MRLASFSRTSLPARDSMMRQLPLISIACSGFLQNLFGDELAGDVQIVDGQQSSSEKKVPSSVERPPHRAEVVVFKNHVTSTSSDRVNARSVAGCRLDILQMN
jgi:hypothetical protein